MDMQEEHIKLMGTIEKLRAENKRLKRKIARIRRLQKSYEEGDSRGIVSLIFVAENIKKALKANIKPKGK